MSDFFTDISGWHAVLVVALLSFAGLLKGYSGYGFLIAAVPLLTLIFPPVVAVPIALLVQIISSGNGMRDCLHHCDWRIIGVLAASAAALTPFGVILLTELPEDVVRFCIAGIVALAVALLASPWRRQHSPNPWVAAIYGAVSGLFNGVAGIPGPPVIAYFLGSNIAKERARASMMVIFALTSVVALVPLYFAGALTTSALVYAVISLPAVWGATSLGQYLFHRSSDMAYRRVGLLVLSAIALLAALKAANLIH
jgi:uncharacterized membrane protein YfcA